jgi:hypothetical protein
MNLLENLNSFLPVYATELPFSKQVVSFTPFKVKDAKNISVVLQEENKLLSLKALYEILKNSTKDVVVENLCLADAEYLFLMIRGKSIEEKINLLIDNKPIQIKINEIKWKNELVSKDIKVSNELSFNVETPVLKDLLKFKQFSKKDFLLCSIKTITANKEIYDVSKFVTDEIKQFLENMPISVLNELEKIKHPELYINVSNDETESEVSGLLTFFTFP